MVQQSKILVTTQGKIEGAELSFCLPFNTYYEMLATSDSACKHRVTIWLLGGNSHTRFEQQEKGLFGRDVFLASAEENDGFPGFPVNVRIESICEKPGADWRASKLRISPNRVAINNFLLIESIDSESGSSSWDDCNLLFNIVE